MDKKKKTLIGALAAAIVLVIAFVVYITCFDYHIEFSGAFDKGITVEYGNKFEMPKIKAYEKGHFINRKGKEIKCTVDSNVDETKVGSYEIKITAKYKKKTKTQTIKVEIVDKKAPEITLTGDAETTVEAGSEYADPGYSAQDNYDGDLTDKVKVSGDVDTSKPGDYKVKYTVSDSSDNDAEVTRTVHVTDTTAPEIVLEGDDCVMIKKGDKYKEPGYKAEDNCDGDITDNVTVSGDKVDTDTVGKYTINYEVEDSSGNKGTASRVVRVYAPAANVNANAVNPGDKVIYLTFDDGPGEYTSQLLDILDKYNVKVTFFVTNTHPDYQNLIAEEAKRGHTVAIHSASHNYGKIYSSENAYFDDLDEMNSIIKAQTGSDASIIRFPGGSSNAVSKKYCKGIMTQLTNDVTARGLLYCDWNVSSGDAGETKNTDTVVQNVISGVQQHNVSVVLQHDIKGFSVNAVERIIQWGLSEGYTFLPLTTSSPMVHHGINN
ncbi:polysaccharide deacetylase family protein [Agathobacter sp.]